MIRLATSVVAYPIMILTILVGCGPKDDNNPPLDPSDAELAETIDEYCNTMVACRPDDWQEPKHENCVKDQEGSVARRAECRQAQYELYECIIELGSCMEIDAINQAPGTPCRDENVNSGMLYCFPPPDDS